MEAAEETLTYLNDTGLHRKLLPEDKNKKDNAKGIKSDESNYVDLDMKPDGARTVKVTFTGEGNQLSVIKCDGSKPGIEDKRDTVPVEPRLDSLTKLPNPDSGSEDDRQLQAELEPSDFSEPVCSESDELQCTDMYLNSKTESDDGVLSDHCCCDSVEDESHYITTHEIQLTELDHDVDYDLGRGTCWDFEDDNLVYSFVDYASFESDETQEGTLILEGQSQPKALPDLGGAAVSTEQEEESDLCDSDKCASSDESVCKNQICDDGNEGKIHVSIKTSSRAVNEPAEVFDNTTRSYTTYFGEGGNFSFVNSGARAEPLGDSGQYFIPAPGRQHLATKLRRKDINEYSSGASSSISELDDADKEVRNLTAKSFRSLACPYFDAIHLSTSSESSMSEYGLNKWSAYVDWNYGNISQRRERSVIAHKTSSARLEMNKSVDSKRHGKFLIGMKAPQSKMYAQNKRQTSQQDSSSSRKIEPKDPVQPKHHGVTLNFRYNVESHEGGKSPHCSKNTRSNEFIGRLGFESQSHPTESMGDTHKRAIFASSLLKNVISKKMQFEQERKMERGEICDTHAALSPDMILGRVLRTQTSQSGSGFTFNSADDQHQEGSRASSCEPTEEQKGNKVLDDFGELPKAALSHSKSSAFNSLKADEPEAGREAEPQPVSEPQTTAREDLETSSVLEKRLFVPSCQLIPPSTGTPVVPQKSEREFKTGYHGKIGKDENQKEIKICLRSVNENKGCTLNIANLLTPKIRYNTVNTFRAAADSKCSLISVTEKIPNFTVRDIRDTKCKLQTPIYHVRDVRKLVKSSYLGNNESKCSTAVEKLEEKTKKELVKHVSPSPIVIKCHSIKTNAKSETNEVSQKQTETGVPSETSQTENALLQCTTHRVAPIVSKQQQPDQSEIQTNVESKLAKQRQEKFAAETVDRKSEPTVPNQAALEKLRAAVKTMEQLYVFDRNEWKRKSQAPQPIRDSHVLSLIAREEQVTDKQKAENIDRIPQSLTNTTKTGKPQEGKAAVNIIHVPFNNDIFKPQPQKSKTFSNKSILHFGNGNKAHVSISSVNNSVLQSPALQTPSSMESSKMPATPLSVKIEPPKHSQVEQGKVKISANNLTVTQGCSDSENYLTIPGLGYTNKIKLLNPEPVLREGNSNVNQTHTSGKTPEQKSLPLFMEYPATSIYHHCAATKGQQTQQQMLCFSSPVQSMSPTSLTDTAPQTQRKMLLDPTTGHYYLVDTPIQPNTKRLFDPETGQYMDVPMSHSPVAPVTPVPLSLSPLTLSPGAYAPTCMIYPSFIPSPTLPAQAMLPQAPCLYEDAGGDRIKKGKTPRPESSTAGAESTYYSAKGEAAQASLQLPVNLGHVTTRGGATISERKPVISITTQQGPRIIAPPSFDGTTMSFVVEHR
ncbi:uncharacterized protein C4orf54-like [Echeneis naucrates]|uniref:DUF4585 domain-containing protein n=1 Tax=Echeneis naucrates TaxID=173247 RepID=A0A665T114_ECHNA|nr:uncharacterized protein C4orf54-like [Echeneis naucrates]